MLVSGQHFPCSNRRKQSIPSVHNWKSLVVEQDRIAGDNQLYFSHFAKASGVSPGQATQAVLYNGR
jgi:hypothetical protein